LQLLWFQFALGDGVVVQLAQRRQALVQRWLRGFQHHHRNAGVEEIHGYAHAHHAGADHGGRGHRAQGRIGRYIGHLAGDALGKESVAQRLRFSALDQVHETFAFELHAFIEWHGDRCTDGGNALERRRIAGRPGAGMLARILQDRLGMRMVNRPVAHLGQWPEIGNAVGKDHRRGDQIRAGLEYAVEQRRIGQLFRQDRLAGDDHGERLFQPQHARQALGAAGARQQAQFNLGQRDFRSRQRHAVMATERQLQPAAHANGVDSGHDRLGRAFCRGNKSVQRRLGQRLGGIEFADIGAARERLAGAGDDDGLDGDIGERAFDAGHGSGARGQPHAVDRRIVQSDNGNGAVNLVFGSHVLSLDGLLGPDRDRT